MFVQMGMREDDVASNVADAWGAGPTGGRQTVRTPLCHIFVMYACPPRGLAGAVQMGMREDVGRCESPAMYSGCLGRRAYWRTPD